MNPKPLQPGINHDNRHHNDMDMPVVLLLLPIHLHHIILEDIHPSQEEEILGNIIIHHHHPVAIIMKTILPK
jgi:hypothetical protein